MMEMTSVNLQHAENTHTSSTEKQCVCISHDVSKTLILKNWDNITYKTTISATCFEMSAQYKI